MATAAIASTTGTGTPYTFSLAAGQSAQVFVTPALAPGEYVQLNRDAGTGSGGYDIEVRDSKGKALLSNRRSSATVTGPGYFELNKDATSVAIGVWIDT